jgi:flavorubredoxin
MPWLHWPETMVTYIPKSGILLTGDIFGGYSIPQGLFDDEADVEAYLHFARKYTATVIGHYKEKIGKNIGKMETLRITPRMILPAHGVLWRKDPQRIVQSYLDWGEGKAQRGKVTVVYSSMYRFVERAMGIAIDELEAQGILTSGLPVRGRSPCLDSRCPGRHSRQ